MPCHPWFSEIEAADILGLFHAIARIFKGLHKKGVCRFKIIFIKVDTCQTEIDLIPFGKTVTVKTTQEQWVLFKCVIDFEDSVPTWPCIGPSLFYGNKWTARR